MLRLDEIAKSFGGLKALDQVGFQVQPGEILGLIGPNGAGKTTLFNVISGILHPDSGKVFFREQNITGLATHQIAKLGLCRTFQNPAIFEEMTVLENLMAGYHLQGRSGFFSAILKPPWERKEERSIRERAMEMLSEIGLKGSAQAGAGSLSFGKMRMLELGRALCSHPELLLLDEPAAGLNHNETEELAEYIGRLRSRKITIIVIEHDMSLVMDLSDRIVVLDQGRKIAEGAPKEIQRDPAVLKAYLGEEDWIKSLRR